MAGTNSKCPFYRGICLIESQIQGVKNGRDQLEVSFLQRCPSYRESNIGVKNGRDQLEVSFLQRCLSYRESNIGNKEWQGPTLSVRFTEVSVLYMKMQLLKASKIYRRLYRRGSGGRGWGGGIFTIQTSVKSHDLEELYLQLVFNKSLSNLAILQISRCYFQWCQRIFSNLFMSKVKKNCEKVYSLPNNLDLS